MHLNLETYNNIPSNSPSGSLEEEEYWQQPAGLLDTSAPELVFEVS